MLVPPQPVLVSSRAVKGISITKNRNFREDLKFFLSPYVSLFLFIYTCLSKLLCES